MKILLCFDDGYAPHAATLMEELIDHASTRLGFAVVHSDSLSGEVMDKLVHHFSTRVESLEFHRVDPARLEGYAQKSSTAHLQHAEAYLRLFAPFYIRDAKVLYLDIDLTVQEDITRIMDEVKEPQWVYAVKGYDERADAAHPRLARRFKRREAYKWLLRFGLSRPIKYFNSGVMIMDLDLWRRDGIAERLFEMIASMEVLPGADQDVLNRLLDGRFGELTPRWNVLALGAPSPLTGYPAQQLQQATAHPAISHYIGVRKQWNWLQYSPLTRESYWKYRALTPWPATRPADATLRNILWRAYRNHAPRFVVAGVRWVIRIFDK